MPLRHPLGLLLVASAIGCSPGLNRLWEQNVGDYSQTPAIAPDGTLVSYSYDTYQGSIRYAGYDPSDGSELWFHSHGYGGTRPAGLDGDGNLIVNGQDRIYGIDTRDGSEVWSVDYAGYGSLHAVDGDRVYLVRQQAGGGGSGHHLVAIDREEVLWSEPLNEVPSGLAVGKDGNLFLSSNGVVSYDPEGAPRWEVPLAGYSYYVALMPGKVLTYEQGVGIHAFDREDGAELWLADVQGDHEPAIAADGTIYAYGNSGLVAVDGDSGAILWETELWLQPSLALGSDGRLYGMAELYEDEEFLELGTKLHFVTLSTSDGEVLWQEWQNESAEALNYAPALDGGRAYFAAGHFLAHIYAFSGAPGLGKGPWPRTGADNQYSYKEQ
jgi:outer membrane protein assembly factor BamB